MIKVRPRMPLWRRLTRVIGAKLFHYSENNGNACMDKNGERWLLSSLLLRWQNSNECRPRVIFDIGANVGDYSAAVLMAASKRGVDVQVHAFEPGTTTRSALLARFRNDPRLQVEPVAVGQNQGKERFHSEKQLSQHASLFRRSIVDSEYDEVVDVIRLDEYVTGKRLAHIDFIKLDVEGAEFEALKGMGDELNPKRVSFIQFEYGGTTLDAGVRLKDFFDLLGARGYVVAKLMPSSLVVRHYSAWMDHFWYANYVAIDAREFGKSLAK